MLNRGSVLLKQLCVILTLSSRRTVLKKEELLKDLFKQQL